MATKKVISMGMCFVPLLFAISFAQEQPCTKAEEIAALESILSLADWDKVYAHFKAYKHCDDGAIAEGYSDRVVHILASQWERLPHLGKIVTKDEAFYRFVLRHIDITADTDELNKVAEYSINRCPDGFNDLCSKISVEAEKDY